MGNDDKNKPSSSGERVWTVEPELLGGLQWRSIGPQRGGRVVAVAGHPTDPMVFYFGGAGGVWKTLDGGIYWQNISDGFFQASAVGALAIADSDPNVIYVGMGESCVGVPRLHWTSRADGMYKSTDGGKTWANVGLHDTRHISRIRVHPKNPDLVYVAVLGHLEGPYKERGVYRTRDGGATWEIVLPGRDQAGAIDLSLDPNNPRNIYASIWQVRRSFRESYSGGPDSGLHKSTDGGDTWTNITNNPGLPEGVKGRMSVAVCPAAPERLWALIEAEDGGLFLSDDGGAKWERVWGDSEAYPYDPDNLNNRAHYYNHLFADPRDPETVYVLNPKIHKSTDGGRTFTEVTAPHADHHDLWIDPNIPRRMINGNDGGACVTFNGGVSWSTIYNQPTGEYYHLAADTRFPYRLYATQQDSSAIALPSRSNKGAILWSDSYTVGSSESGHIAVRPDNPDIVYSGALGSFPGNGPILIRYDHRTAEFRNITVWPDALGFLTKDRKYRFQWDFPIVLSPHDPNVLYCAGNVVFRSTDEGTNWEIISPDLTHNDTEERGPVDLLTDIAPFERGALLRFAESPLKRGVLWAGSDDGLVHVSRDDGCTWENVTPADMPDWSPISGIETSREDPGTAYLAANRYQFGDYEPYVYKTQDYGRSWEKITDGIPKTAFVRRVREDPVRPSLLYAGTEAGVYASLNGGASWLSLQLNMPSVPVHDMLIKDNDLAVATHGRGFWVLDDLTPLHQINDESFASTAHLFRPRPAYRFQLETNPYGDPPPGPAKRYWLSLGLPATFYVTETPEGGSVRRFIDAGNNPPDGVVVYYFLKEKPEGEVELAFLDSKGQVIRRFSSKSPDEAVPSGEKREPQVAARPGTNRFVWDMAFPGARGVPGHEGSESQQGPTAPPGRYVVRLTVDGQTIEQPLEIIKDPRIEAAQEDLEAQFALLIGIRDKISETQDAVRKIRSVRDQVEDWARRAEGGSGAEAVAQSAESLSEKLISIEDVLTERPGRPWTSRRLRAGLKIRTLDGRLADLIDTVRVSYAKPTRQSHEFLDELSIQLDAHQARLGEVMDTDLEAFKNLLYELEIPTIVP